MTQDSAYRHSSLEGKIVIDSYICPNCNLSIEDAVESEDSPNFYSVGSGRFNLPGDELTRPHKHYDRYRGEFYSCSLIKKYKGCDISFEIAHEHVECKECKVQWIKLFYDIS